MEAIAKFFGKYDAAARAKKAVAFTLSSICKLPSSMSKIALFLS